MAHLRTSSRGYGGPLLSPPASKFKAPPHPVPELQGPFEESMAEAAGWEENEVPMDAASRRTLLLDAPTYERIIAGRWRQKRGEKYHPLWKLVAQLSFGIHLLAENLAMSDDDVMQILQGHIDDIDLFLERTTEDLSLGQDDIQERLRCLQLPLQHPKVFDRMLEDKGFRNSIVEGNEKIEHIVARTGCAMKDSLKDAQKGIDATSVLDRYMSRLGETWTRQTEEHEAVFMAMLENVEGWRQAFINLQAHGDNLGNLLRQLSAIINQMQQRAGEVSRKLVRAQQKHGSTDGNGITYMSRNSTTTPTDSRSATPDRSSRKPLPGVPSRATSRPTTSDNMQNLTVGQRPPTNLTHRSETAMSARSVLSQRSAELHDIRNQSRQDDRASARNSKQSAQTGRTPRLVEIRRNSPRSLTPTDIPMQKQSMNSSQTSLQPVELPTQTLRTFSQTGYLPGAQNSNTGLGIMNSGKPVNSTSKSDNARTASPGVVSELAGNLPLTPSSITSNPETKHKSIYELSSGVSTFEHQVAEQVPSQNGESSLQSPPSTPGWAKTTFEHNDRNRAVTDKTAFRSHPPNMDLGSPPVLLSSRAYVQPHHERQNQSIASSLGNPGPEVASSERTASVRSASFSGSTSEASFSKPSEPSAQMPEKTQDVTTPEPKGFTAELEGSLPMFPRPPASRNIIAELEAPVQTSMSQHRVLSTNAGTSGRHAKRDLSVPEAVSEETASDLSAVEVRMANAVRRSFIAKNIELPGSFLEDVPSDPAKEDTPTSEIPISVGENKPSTKPAEPEILLPRSYYTSPRKVSKEVHKKQGDVSVETSSRSFPSPVLRKLSSIVTSPSSLNQLDNKSSVRTSSASSASSQSQWRAFFQGQLSPSDFTTTSPTLLTSCSPDQKIPAETNIRGQIASPTLGWQWAPMTPEVEEKTAGTIAA